MGQIYSPLQTVICLWVTRSQVRAEAVSETKGKGHLIQRKRRTMMTRMRVMRKEKAMMRYLIKSCRIRSRTSRKIWRITSHQELLQMSRVEGVKIPSTDLRRCSRDKERDWTIWLWLARVEASKILTNPISISLLSLQETVLHRAIKLKGARALELRATWLTTLSSQRHLQWTQWRQQTD